MRQKNGFTLVELIVVIIIIAILAGIGFIGYLGAQARARDSKRQSDASGIASALELYKTDRKIYPTISADAASCVTLGCNLTSSQGTANERAYEASWKALQTELADYLTPLPVDERAGDAMPGYPSAKLQYIYYDRNMTTTTSTCATDGNCYTIWIPSETTLSEPFCVITGTSIVSGRYVCIKN